MASWSHVFWRRHYEAQSVGPRVAQFSRPPTACAPIATGTQAEAPKLARFPEGGDFEFVVALELVERDRADPTHREYADDDVADDAEVVVDRADRAPEAAAIRKPSRSPIRFSVSRPPTTTATTTDTAVIVML